ncbi:exopolysaccharide biosynthesis protein [Oleiagrimonas sp. C23AA]|uniref:exopolysaccharide biosynthesis protein n=1 Tax=Oleiagrimonas sp. C23AA TaxID=2719047 RepID=UPI00141EC401|nr:exopolysaccharide biosynthesis protein [Oleiagrimonas sp. C23AA]NII11538.1 exopolysaccharide biosynthesis protein [Oleiagrimonas sp. C23AA]
MDAHTHRRTTDVLADALAAHPHEYIVLDDLIAPLNSRAFGCVLLLLAIPNFIPVPLGVGGVMGVLTMLLGVQMAAGMRQPWIPGWLRRRQLKREAVARFLARSAPIMRRLERLCRPRLEALTGRGASVFTGVLLFLIGILLALPIPFTNYLFGGMLLAYALALIERDGGMLMLLWTGSVAMVLASATFSGALVRLMHEVAHDFF